MFRDRDPTLSGIATADKVALPMGLLTC